MFKKQDFDETVFDKSKLTNLSSYVYKDGMTGDEVNQMIDEILFGLQAFPEAPNYVFTRSIYENNVNVFERGKFTLRVAAKSKLTNLDINSAFEIHANDNMFDELIDEFINFFKGYEYLFKLDANLNELNIVVGDAIAAEDLGIMVSFTCGELLSDITDNSIVIGLTDEVIKDLSNSPLFDEQIEIRAENYKSIIVDTIKACVKPFDIFTVKNTFTKDFGIYSRKNAVKLIRRVVNRKIGNVRAEGIGYYDEDKVFAVIEKVAIKSDDMKDFSDCTFYANVEASSADKKKDLDTIAVKFKVSPFDKDTLANVDKSIEDILGVENKIEFDASLVEDDKSNDEMKLPVNRI